MHKNLRDQTYTAKHQSSTRVGPRACQYTGRTPHGRPRAPRTGRSMSPACRGGSGRNPSHGGSVDQSKGASPRTETGIPNKGSRIDEGAESSAHNTERHEGCSRHRFRMQKKLGRFSAGSPQLPVNLTGTGVQCAPCPLLYGHTYWCVRQASVGRKRKVEVWRHQQGSHRRLRLQTAVATWTNLMIKCVSCIATGGNWHNQ